MSELEGRLRPGRCRPATSRAVIVGINDYSQQQSLPHGALTQGLLNVISQSAPAVTYSALIDQLRNDLQNNQKVTQTPTLLGQENRMTES